MTCRSPPGRHEARSADNRYARFVIAAFEWSRERDDRETHPRLMALDYAIDLFMIMRHMLEMVRELERLHLVDPNLWRGQAEPPSSGSEDDP